VKVDDLYSTKFENFCSDMNGIFLNLDWNKEPHGVLLSKLRGLELAKEFLKNGFLFMWSEKSLLGDIIEIIETKGFEFKESITIAQLDSTLLNKKAIEEENLGKRKNLLTYFKQMETAQSELKGEFRDTAVSILEKKLPCLTRNDLDNAYYKREHPYICQSKLTLLMFRKVIQTNQVCEGNPFELRRRRNEDAFFDLINITCQNGLDRIGLERVYRLIETLLLKSKRNPEVPKLAEIGGHKMTARPGWITFYEA
jgi:hypothetical protein